MLSDKLKSEKGSTLVVLLIFLTILSMLSIAIISFSITNMKMKLMDTKVKQTFYLAEAGLEEAYLLINIQVDKAIASGISNIDIELPIFIEKEIMKIEDDPPIESLYIKEDGSIDEAAIIPKLKQWFREGYTGYLNENLIVQLNLADYGVLDPSISDSTPKIYVKSEPDPTLTLKSSFSHEGVTKEIEARFKINIPEYDMFYDIKNQDLGKRIKAGVLVEMIGWERIW